MIFGAAPAGRSVVVNLNPQKQPIESVKADSMGCCFQDTPIRMGQNLVG